MEVGTWSACDHDRLDTCRELINQTNGLPKLVLRRLISTTSSSKSRCAALTPHWPSLSGAVSPPRSTRLRRPPKTSAQLLPALSAKSRRPPPQLDDGVDRTHDCWTGASKEAAYPLVEEKSRFAKTVRSGTARPGQLRESSCLLGSLLAYGIGNTGWIHAATRSTTAEFVREIDALSDADVRIPFPFTDRRGDTC
jgi:hypothetical protein